MRTLGVALAVAACAVASASAEAAERTILVQERPTEVKAHGGTALFSRWDGSAYHLAISRAAAAHEDLPVPPQAVPFDADIGPDARGRPTVILSRCPVGEDCHLVRLRLGSAILEPLRTTDDPSRDEIRPSVVGGRVAFVRVTREGQESRHRVLTRRLRDPARRTSTVLAELGARARVEELELGPRHVALSTVDLDVDGGVCGERAVRVVGLRTRSDRILARQLCGLNGQSWAGPTFGGSWLYVARYCVASPCEAQYGAYRVSLRTGRTELATFGRRLTGWAYDADGRAYVASDDEGGCTLQDDSEIRPRGCRVSRVSGLRFRPAAARGT